MDWSSFACGVFAAWAVSFIISFAFFWWATR
jgi:hypothetical protein